MNCEHKFVEMASVDEPSGSFRVWWCKVCGGIKITAYGMYDYLHTEEPELPEASKA